MTFSWGFFVLVCPIAESPRMTMDQFILFPALDPLHVRFPSRNVVTNSLLADGLQRIDNKAPNGIIFLNFQHLNKER